MNTAGKAGATNPMTMKYLKTIALLMLLATQVMAQVRVESAIDTPQILIGEQAHVTLTVTLREGQSAALPEYEPSARLIEGVEVVAQGEVDTTKLDNQMQRLSRVYTLTSFDDSLYALPPFKAVVDGKEYQAKKLALKVVTIDVDTEHPDQFFPPKGLQTNPFMWKEWVRPFWMSMLLIILCLLLYYLVIRLGDNKPIVARIRFVKKVLPHKKAFSVINKLKSKSLNTDADQKAYYTTLVDTLRTYLKERFGFNAMEMTSSEIIERLSQEEDTEKLNELRSLFQTADLVKFAKYSTEINEKDRNLESVVEFIETTKTEDMPTIEKIEPTLTESDKRSQKSRRLVITLIALTAISILVVLAFTCWQLYLLVL